MELSDSQKWWLLALFAVLGWLFYLLAPVLMPFAFAAVLAYLGDPLVDRLEVFHYRWVRFNRTTAVVLVFLGFIALITALLFVIIPAIEYQIGAFIEKLPSYLDWINRSVIPGLQKYLGRGVRSLKTDQMLQIVRTYWQEGEDGSLLSSVSHSGAVVFGWLMNALLVPVISFYLLRDWDDLMRRIHDLFPRRYAPLVSQLAGEADEVLGAFMRGQFYVMMAMSLIYSFGLWLIDLELALSIGVLAGLISFVPYLGLMSGIALASIGALLQFQDGAHLLSVLMVFGIGHAIEGMVLTPWLVGNKIGLHPVAVIFAILAGGQLFGFLGVLMALPLASVVMVLLRHVHDRYTGSGYYSHGSKL